jgi:hypothetical protein
MWHAEGEADRKGGISSEVQRMVIAWDILR